MLQAVLSSGRRAAALVDQLVGTTGRKSDEQEHLDLAPLLTQLEPDLVRLSPRGTTVVVDVGADPLPVEVDESDLRQAITNLVVNGMEATGDGGRVTVRARLVPASDGGGPAMVELVVEDDGSGMEPDTESRIFEPFFTTRVGGGRSRGLGLPAVQGVVLRSRGEIDVETRPGVGTVVTVRLPCREQVLDATPVLDAPIAPPATDGRATILLVDDEPEVRTMTGRVLANAGYTVISAGDAAEALEVLVSGDAAIDLLVTDVVMPGRSGVDLAHDATTRHPGLPVLLLSGFVGESAHAGITADLPFPLLAKPTPRAALLDAVADLLPVPV
jgi:CheY-like chemotaxis protein